MPDLVPIKRALISVSDKTDLIPFARRLRQLGAELVSTGGTAAALREAGLEVIGIEEVTGFPEMMDGRLKTLHPLVHGGLLGLREKESHARSMREHGITAIDLVCVNLYPFERTIRTPGVNDEQAIEQIDIGGPSMVRSAAKNHAYVAVVTDPSQYDLVITNIDANRGATSLGLRRRLAAAAFARTAAYDAAIAQWMEEWLGRANPERFPQRLDMNLHKFLELRYGENPHQRGALYSDDRSLEASICRARQLHGKELSFNNLYDGNGALELVKEIDASRLAAVAVIKHANPCGFAVSDDLAEAFVHAYSGDPVAAFGGIVALNREVDLRTAQAIVEGQKFLEVIVAPGYAPEALELLGQRWKNVRLLAVGPLPAPAARDGTELDAKRVVGGMLVQERDLAVFEPKDWQHQAGPAPTAAELEEMVIGMVAVKHLKSNAVALMRERMLVGAGAGQMDRVASCRIACEKAMDRCEGATAASDAFFPFRDGPDVLIRHGVARIVEPGGSVRDAETVQACRDAGVTLMFTGRRHFRH